MFLCLYFNTINIFSFEINVQNQMHATSLKQVIFHNDGRNPGLHSNILAQNESCDFHTVSMRNQSGEQFLASLKVYRPFLFELTLFKLLLYLILILHHERMHIF